MKKEEFEMQSL